MGSLRAIRVGPSFLFGWKELMKTPTIDQLLIEPHKVLVPTGKTIRKEGEKAYDEEVPVWIRPLTEIERSLAQGAARAHSKSMRKVLSNPDSEEHQLLIQSEVEDLTREQLEQAWVASNLINRAMQVRRKSLEDRDDSYIPEPEGSPDGVILPTAEELEAYEEAVEGAEDQREENVKEAVKNVRTQLEEEVVGMDDDVLKAEVVPKFIDSICGNVWNREYSLQQILRGTFKDKKLTQRAFESIGDVYALKDSAKQKLAEEHMGLLIDPDAIKN